MSHGLLQESAYQNHELISKFLNVWEVEELNLVMIKGWSIGGEVLHEKYGIMLDRVDKHFEEGSRLSVYIRYELFDAITVSYLFKLFKKLNHYHRKEKKILVNWIVQETDSEVFDSGNDFKQLCEFPFFVIVE